MVLMTGEVETLEGLEDRGWKEKCDTLGLKDRGTGRRRDNIRMVGVHGAGRWRDSRRFG